MDGDAQRAQYFAGMWPHLDEHARRLVAASLAVELGCGGVSRVSRACGLSRVTLIKGLRNGRPHRWPGAGFVARAADDMC
jgi:DNA-binding phage protein